MYMLVYVSLFYYLWLILAYIVYCFGYVQMSVKGHIEQLRRRNLDTLSYYNCLANATYLKQVRYTASVSTVLICMANTI